MEAEFMFSYGNFGYGYSHQPIEYPAFLSPDLNVTVGMPATKSQSSQPFAVRLEKLHQQPWERLEKLKKEYRNLNTWMEKSNYLIGALNSQLEHKKPKGSNTSKVPESQFEERPEDTVTSVAPLIKEEAEMIPSELLDSDDEKGLTLRDKDNSSAIASENDESTKQADTSLPIIPSLTITEENKIPPLEDSIRNHAIWKNEKCILFTKSKIEKQIFKHFKNTLISI